MDFYQRLIHDQVWRAFIPLFKKTHFSRLTHLTPQPSPNFCSSVGGMEKLRNLENSSHLSIKTEDTPCREGWRNPESPSVMMLKLDQIICSSKISYEFYRLFKSTSPYRWNFLAGGTKTIRYVRPFPTFLYHDYFFFGEQIPLLVNSKPLILSKWPSAIELTADLAHMLNPGAFC